MTRSDIQIGIALALVFSLAAAPQLAFAADSWDVGGKAQGSSERIEETVDAQGVSQSKSRDGAKSRDSIVAKIREEVMEDINAIIERETERQAAAEKAAAEKAAAEKAAAEKAAAEKAAAEKAAAEKAAAEKAAKSSKLLSYDPAAIAAIGSQAESGHGICCPSYACAYADAVLDGTVRDHSYYTCSSCSWTDWGGGGSWDRCVGSDQELLREAFDQISAGRPTVVHVTWSGGEHWIALIGYENAVDPDNLSLANFIALDPWDGAQINAAEKYALYGDGCEHVSDR